MTAHHKHHVPWYLWPFWAIWMLLATIVEFVGRFVAIMLGLVLILVGFMEKRQWRWKLLPDKLPYFVLGSGMEQKDPGSCKYFVIQRDRQSDSSLFRRYL